MCIDWCFFYYHYVWDVAQIRKLFKKYFLVIDVSNTYVQNCAVCKLVCVLKPTNNNIKRIRTRLFVCLSWRYYFWPGFRALYLTYGFQTKSSVK